MTAAETSLCDAAEVEAAEKKMQEVLELDDYYAIRASTPVRVALEHSLAHIFPQSFAIARFYRWFTIGVDIYMHASHTDTGSCVSV